MSSIPRNYSDRFEQGSSDLDLLNNRNVEWMKYRFFRLSYVIFVVVAWAVLHTSQLFSPGECWTVINVVHGLVRICTLELIIFYTINEMSDYLSSFALDQGLP